MTPRGTLGILPRCSQISEEKQRGVLLCYTYDTFLPTILQFHT